MKTKIAIFSGGSGSDSLIKGLLQIGTDNIEITNIINLYDDGKSTGVCRRVMNCLGPSDLRKVQYSQLPEIVHCNYAVRKFFNERPDLNIDLFEKCCESYLDGLMPTFDVTELYECIGLFKERLLKYYNNNKVLLNTQILKNFNIANIFYSTMFATRGVKETIKYFKELFYIKHDVVINSYSNVELFAKTKNHENTNFKPILSEGEMVDLPENIEIESLFYSNNVECNKEMYEVLLNSDMLIISSGTTYSSIIPTLQTPTIAEKIKRCSAKKIFVCNSNFDGDSKNKTLDDLLSEYEKYIDLDQFTFVLNEDGNSEFLKWSKLKNKRVVTDSFDYPIHNKLKLGQAVFSIYFNAFFSFDSLFVFDFDGTIYDKGDIYRSEYNIFAVEWLSQHSNVKICTGNSIDHIKHIDVDRQFNNDKIEIFANASNDKYINYELVDDEFVDDPAHTSIDEEIIEKLKKYAIDNSLIFENRNNKCFTIKVKNGNRCTHYDKLQNYAHQNRIGIYYNGNTSIDFIKGNAFKTAAFSDMEFRNMVYFGDNPQGNDREMFKNAKVAICVNPNTLNIILTMLQEMKRNEK